MICPKCKSDKILTLKRRSYKCQVCHYRNNESKWYEHLKNMKLADEIMREWRKPISKFIA